MKRLSIILLAFIAYSCSTKKQDQKADAIQLLIQALGENLKENNVNLLCMFISDNMCVACIEKEFLNIKSANISVTLIKYIHGE